MKENDLRREPGSSPIERRHTPADHQTRRRVSSTDLLGTCRELLIDHLGEIYVLRHTSKGKLILTK
jgi:hemin uptake protein HemP